MKSIKHEMLVMLTYFLLEGNTLLLSKTITVISDIIISPIVTGGKLLHPLFSSGKK